MSVICILLFLFRLDHRPQQAYQSNPMVLEWPVRVLSYNPWSILRPNKVPLSQQSVQAWDKSLQVVAIVAMKSNHEPLFARLNQVFTKIPTPDDGSSICEMAFLAGRQFDSM